MFDNNGLEQSQGFVATAYLSEIAYLWRVATKLWALSNNGHDGVFESGVSSIMGLAIEAIGKIETYDILANELIVAFILKRYGLWYWQGSGEANQITIGNLALRGVVVYKAFSGDQGTTLNPPNAGCSRNQ
jgi:hypothetical protein